MIRNSFTFLGSYYDAILDLPEELQPGMCKAIIDYSFARKEPEFTDKVCIMMWKLIKPNLDSSFKKFQNGKSKKKAKEKQKESKKETNPSNEIEREIEIDINNNTKDSNNNLFNYFDYVEQKLKVVISPNEYEIISQWDNIQLVIYAIDIALSKKINSVKYVDKIISDLKSKNITSFEDIVKHQKKNSNLIENLNKVRECVVKE